MNKFSRLSISCSAVFLCLFVLPGSSLLKGQSDSRAQAVHDFMWGRIQANGVDEYQYMTDHLKNEFLHKRKFKIPHESSRLISFQFNPAAIEDKGGKRFEVNLVGTWVNLNDHLIGDISERDTFEQTPSGWRADALKFGKEEPTPLAVVEGFGSPKDYRDPLRVLKNVLRAWADRDPAAATKYTSIDFEQGFKSRQELQQLFAGNSSPRHVAYAIRRIASTDRDYVVFEADLYERADPAPRLTSSRVRIHVKKFESAWLVDTWSKEIDTPNPR